MEVKAYWEKEREVSNQLPLNLTMTQKEFPSQLATVYEISYESLYEERIYGWFIEPKNQTNYPLVIEYIGYMNHLVSPLQFMEWLSVGCGVLVTDSRGQGGKTLDSHPYNSYEGNSLMAKGFLERDDFYLRRLYWDALRLIDVAQELPLVDKKRVFIHGTSQGGGVGLFANSWTTHDIRYSFFDVPSHSDLKSRIAAGTGSYKEIHEYLLAHKDQEEQVHEVMSYFDVKDMVDQISNPVLASVGESDPICPKEDFYKAYDKLTGFKELDCYKEPGHGGGGLKHTEKLLRYVLKEMNGD